MYWLYLIGVKIDWSKYWRSWYWVTKTIKIFFCLYCFIFVIETFKWVDVVVKLYDTWCLLQLYQEINISNFDTACYKLILSDELDERLIQVDTVWLTFAIIVSQHGKSRQWINPPNFSDFWFLIQTWWKLDTKLLRCWCKLMELDEAWYKLIQLDAAIETNKKRATLNVDTVQLKDSNRYGIDHNKDKIVGTELKYQ